MGTTSNCAAADEIGRNAAREAVPRLIPGDDAEFGILGDRRSPRSQAVVAGPIRAGGPDGRTRDRGMAGAARDVLRPLRIERIVRPARVAGKDDRIDLEAGAGRASAERAGGEPAELGPRVRALVEREREAQIGEGGPHRHPGRQEAEGLVEAPRRRPAIRTPGLARRHQITPETAGQSTSPPARRPSFSRSECRSATEETSTPPLRVGAPGEDHRVSTSAFDRSGGSLPRGSILTRSRPVGDTGLWHGHRQETILINEDP